MAEFPGLEFQRKDDLFRSVTAGFLWLLLSLGGAVSWALADKHCVLPLTLRNT
jgi:hypothetical protein